MQISPSPLVRASWLAFNISLFFSLSFFFSSSLSPSSRERGRGEREHLKKKSAEKTWELLNKNLTQTSPAGGLQARW